MINWNFHTHSSYCDGKDTLRELADRAVELGFNSLGFSGHVFTDFDRGYCMSQGDTERYIAEANALKAEYSDRCRLFCGIEYDIFSSADRTCFDYVIGSVHYIKIGGRYLPVDMSPSVTSNIVKHHFGGSFDSYAKAYFELEAEVAERTGCDIIGHIDLVSKYSEALHFGESDAFLCAAEDAVKSLVKYKKPFEINTGAIARGARSVPYPSLDILKMIYSNGGSVTVSSDCHDKQYLDFGFEEAVLLAKRVGFKTVKKFTENGFRDIEI